CALGGQDSAVLLPLWTAAVQYRSGGVDGEAEEPVPPAVPEPVPAAGSGARPRRRVVPALICGVSVGVLLSLVGARVPWVELLFTSNTGGIPDTAYVEVNLLRDDGSNVVVVWNGTVTCPGRDTYRTV